MFAPTEHVPALPAAVAPAIPSSPIPINLDIESRLSLLAQQQVHHALESLRTAAATERSGELLVLRCQKHVRELTEAMQKLAELQHLASTKSFLGLAPEWQEIKQMLREAGCRYEERDSIVLISPPDREQDWQNVENTALRQVLNRISRFWEKCELAKKVEATEHAELTLRLTESLKSGIEALQSTPFKLSPELKELLAREETSLREQVKGFISRRPNLRGFQQGIPDSIELDQASIIESRTMTSLNGIQTLLAECVPYSQSELLSFPGDEGRSRIVRVVDQTTGMWFLKRDRLLRLQSDLHAIDLRGKRPELIKAASTLEHVLRERTLAFDQIRPDNAVSTRLLHDLSTLSAVIQRTTLASPSSDCFRTLNEKIKELGNLRQPDEGRAYASKLWTLGESLDDCARELSKETPGLAQSTRASIQEMCTSLANECRNYTPEKLVKRLKEALREAPQRLETMGEAGVGRSQSVALRKALNIPEECVRAKGEAMAQSYQGIEALLEKLPQNEKQKAELESMLRAMDRLFGENPFFCLCRMEGYVKVSESRVKQLLATESFVGSERRDFTQLQRDLRTSLQDLKNKPDDQAAAFGRILQSLDKIEARRELLPDLRRIKEYLLELSERHVPFAKRLLHQTLAELAECREQLPKHLQQRLDNYNSLTDPLALEQEGLKLMSDLRLSIASLKGEPILQRCAERAVRAFEVLNPCHTLHSDTYRELKAIMENFAFREESELRSEKLNCERNSLDSLFQFRETMISRYNHYLLSAELGSFVGIAAAAVRDRFSSEAHERKTRLQEQFAKAVDEYKTGLSLLQEISKADSRDSLHKAQNAFLQHMKMLNGYMSVEIDSREYLVSPDPKGDSEGLEKVFRRGAEVPYVYAKGSKPAVLDPRWRREDIAIYRLENLNNPDEGHLVAIHGDKQAGKAFELIPGVTQLKAEDFEIRIATLQIHSGMLGDFIKDLEKEYQGNASVVPWIHTAMAIQVMSSMALLLPQNALGSGLFFAGGSLHGLALSYDGSPEFSIQRHVFTDLFVYAVTLGMGKAFQGALREALLVKNAQHAGQVFLDAHSKQLLFRALNGTVVPISTGAAGGVLYAGLWRDHLTRDTQLKLREVKASLEKTTDPEERQLLIRQRSHLEDQQRSINEISLLRSAFIGGSFGVFLSANSNVGRPVVWGTPSLRLFNPEGLQTGGGSSFGRSSHPNPELKLFPPPDARPGSQP